MQILFFASLREALNTEAESWVKMKSITDVKQLLEHLKERGEPWASALSNPQLIFSVNQEVASLDSQIKLGDEVAFFPPVTGG